jgi:hypothetical protein
MNISSDRLPRDPTAAVPAGPLRSHKDLGISLLVFLLCLLVYNANLRLIATGDSYPARYLPFGLWRYHTLLLDPISNITAQGRKILGAPDSKRSPNEWSDRAYWMVRNSEGHIVSLYPVVIPLFLAPLYLPAVAYLDAKGWEPWRLDQVARIMEKLSASMLAAISAALLYLLLRRRTGRGAALLLTVAYAFGTTTWMVSSQALWQQGPAELLIVAMLLVVTGLCTTRAVIAAGLICGLIASNRPHDSIFAAALGIYGLWWAGRKAPLLVGAALVPLALLLAYNLRVVGQFTGGYGLIVETSFSSRSFFAHNTLTGMAGLLFSPTRGLFVFSPFLLYLLICSRQVFRDRDSRFLTIAISTAIALQLAIYASNDWRQGATWGPRWLISMLPMLVWMLPPVFDALRRNGRIVFVSLCLVAITIEAIGASWYTGTSDAPIYAITAGPNALRAAWDPRNTPFLAELRHPRAPADLAVEARGSLDIAKTADGQDLSAANGKPIVVEGWALAHGRTPGEVLIMLDGRVVASIQDFFVRPDVTKALGVENPSGWRITIGSRELAEGEHLLSVFVRVAEGGNQFFLVDRRFTVPVVPAPAAQQTADGDLASSARRAVAVLSSHQQPAGYWLTSHTRTIRYEQPQQELNTYLPSLLIDMLDPVADQARLAGGVQSARDFLASQIEDTGLVRYHGRPEAIGSLGCVITPDADDTALLWRIAPGTHRDLLRGALATLNRYRTPEGLYRTWLAPRDLYQCIDPGKDPDPADVVIQMHVLMLLATADPPAAHELCQALERTITADRIWVYYRDAPVVPILRQSDLQRAGCMLELPPSRLKPTPPEQAVWVTAAQMLRGLTSGGEPAPASGAVIELLRRLSRDDFRLVRESPPLLYHNDLTASVPRFYWSEDMGYALWLRIHFESVR